MYLSKNQKAKNEIKMFWKDTHFKLLVLNREVMDVIPAPEEKVPALCVLGRGRVRGK